MGSSNNVSCDETLITTDKSSPDWNPSESTTMPVSCPSCGQETSFEIWTVLNVQDNPQKADQLTAGTLADFTCPHCGFQTILDHPCLFVDPDRTLMIYNVCNDPGMTQQAEEVFIELPHINEALKSATLRITNSMTELIEKVAILSANLNDKVIEMLKLNVLGYAQQQNRVSESTPCVVSYTGSDSENIHFRIQTEANNFTSSISKEAYEVFSEALKSIDITTLSEAANKSPYSIDTEWAYYALEAAADEN